MTYRKPIVFRKKNREILTVYDPRIEGSYAHVRGKLIEAEEQREISRGRRDAYLMMLDKEKGKTSVTMDKIIEADEMTDRLFEDDAAIERLIRDIRDAA